MAPDQDNTRSKIKTKSTTMEPLQEHQEQQSRIFLSDEISPSISLGAGCYWGTEKFVVKDFQKKFPGSIQSARVGFMNPTDNTARKKRGPTYQQVCSGTTGYVEVLDVTLRNPALMPELIKFFFMFHDPTTLNRQGNDRGEQYASAIFVKDNAQRQLANDILKELQELVDRRKVKYNRAYVETKVLSYTQFYSAPLAHQDYLTKHPFGYCNHYMRFKIWPKAVSGVKGDTDINRQGEKQEQRGGRWFLWNLFTGTKN